MSKVEDLKKLNKNNAEHHLLLKKQDNKLLIKKCKKWPNKKKHLKKWVLKMMA